MYVDEETRKMVENAINNGADELHFVVERDKKGDLCLRLTVILGKWTGDYNNMEDTQ